MQQTPPLEPLSGTPGGFTVPSYHNLLMRGKGKGPQGVNVGGGGNRFKDRLE